MTLEARWERDRKVENYLQVRMTFIIQVTKKTGDKIPTLLTNFQMHNINNIQIKGAWRDF